jgi:hypothetical protein
MNLTPVKTGNRKQETGNRKPTCAKAAADKQETENSKYRRLQTGIPTDFVASGLETINYKL